MSRFDRLCAALAITGGICLTHSETEWVRAAGVLGLILNIYVLTGQLGRGR
jgi:hypothetical protein